MAVGESAGAAADFKRELDFLLSEHVYCVLLIFFQLQLGQDLLLALLQLLQW